MTRTHPYLPVSKDSTPSYACQKENLGRRSIGERTNVLYDPRNAVLKSLSDVIPILPKGFQHRHAAICSSSDVTQFSGHIHLHEKPRGHGLFIRP